MKYKTPIIEDLKPGTEYEEFIPEGTYSYALIDFQENTLETIAKNEAEWVKKKVPKINYPEVYKYGDNEVEDWMSPMMYETSLISQLQTLIQKGWIRIKDTW